MPFYRFTKDEALEQMSAFVADYQKHSSDLESPQSRYTELEARSEYIDRFLRIFGWDVGNEESRPHHLREVVLERELAESDNGGRPDYRLRLNGRDRLPIEAKKPSIRLDRSPGPSRQARSYGWSLNLPASVLTNVSETIFFDSTIAPEEADRFDVAIMPSGRFKVEDYVNRFDDLWQRLSYESVTSDDYFSLYSYTEPPRGTSAFDRSFLAHFRAWRLELASDIAKHNLLLSDDEIGRRTQRLLNALLFLRVCEDRNIGHYEALLTSAEDESLMAQFQAADRTFNAGLFDVLESTELSPIALRAVVREMYWPRSQFAYGVLRPELLAEVYEQYLSERIETNDYREITLLPKPEIAHAGGVVTTPAWVVSELVTSGLTPQLASEEPVPASLRALDLSMGSGAFLIEILNRLIEAEELAGRQVGLAERGALVQRHIFGVDIDGAAVEVAKLSLLLTILGDEAIDIERDRHVLPDLSRNLLVGNSLIDSKFDEVVPYAARVPGRRAAASPLELGSAFRAVLDEGGFNLIVGNPPYVRIQVLAESMPDQLVYFQDARSRFESAQSHNFDIYQLFFERGLELLAEEGYLAYIVPNRFTNLLPAAAMRRQLAPRLCKLVHFGDQQVFAGRQTYTALVVAGPVTTDFATFEIVNDLEAWRSSRHCSQVQVLREELSGDPWPIAAEDRAEAFAQMMQAGIGVLGDPGWVSIFVGVQTSADDVFFVVPDFDHSTEEMLRFQDKDGIEWEVEREIMRPAVRDRTFEPYGRSPIPDAYVFFPYEIQESTGHGRPRRAKVFNKSTMQQKFPKAHEYLTAKQEVLLRRSISPDPGENFWSYGRSQSLSKMDEPKLIVRVLSLAPQYMLDTEGLVAPGGGDGGPYYLLRPVPECPYPISVVQAILSHPAVDAFVASRGRMYRGAYVVHRKAFMASVPIPELDGATCIDIDSAVTEMQDIVVQLRHETDEALRRTLSGRFQALRQRVNGQLSTAYGLTANQVALFESS
jgi:methylase of polypeptide subunit release factors